MIGKPNAVWWVALASLEIAACGHSAPGSAGRESALPAAPARAAAAPASSSEATKPTSAPTQPALAEAQPATAEAQPAPAETQPATAEAQPAAAEAHPAPADAAPKRDQQCAEALRTLVGDEALVPISRDARDFTLTAAERKAIGRAAKAYTRELYGGAEQRKVSAAFDRWIAGGASLEVLQAVKLRHRRVVIVTFTLASAPPLDVGPYLEVVVSELHARTWRAITNVYFDRDARIVGTVGSDLVFEKLHAPGEPEIWRLSMRKPTGSRPGLESIKATARCR